MEAAAAPAVQKENRFWKGVLAVVGIMTTLVIYGVLQVATVKCTLANFCVIEVAQGVGGGIVSCGGEGRRGSSM
ncbi:hypothetical protein CK203_007298 [Vitis vinifera]|uniref:Uncharacterized protein n=1 Tax=Vitis vinifera TaxID=29760 RepID=A0A438FAI4_VITVI|nr:hypothetical protein CK203_070451 [Vitis vinifera]RVW65990.1 hypothetical protein CK203_007298 [Vitis vinifera]